MLEIGNSPRQPGLLRLTRLSVDWFVPDHLRVGDEESLRRARAVVAFSWLFVPMVPIAWTVYAWLGWEHLIGPVLACWLFLYSVF